MIFNNVTAFARTTVRREMSNQWMNDNYLFTEIANNRTIKPTVEALDGGKVRVTMAKAKNSTFAWVKRGGTITSSNDQQFEAAEFPFAYGFITVYVDGHDLMNNYGSAQDLKAALIKNGVDTLKDTLATDLYNDGTDDSKFIGLKGMTQLASYGGLTTAEVADWASKHFTDSTAMTRDNLGQLWTDVSNYKVPPMGVTTLEVGERIRRMLAGQEQFTKPGDAKRPIGFENVVFNGKTVIYLDQKCTGGGSWTGSHHLWLLNPDHIDFIWHPKMKMVPDQERIPEGKFARIYPYMVGCTMFTDMRKAHGDWLTINPSAAA